MEGCGSLGGEHRPFLCDGAHLGNRQHFLVPRSDPLVFAVAGSEVGEVGELVEVQQVGDGWSVACDILRFVYGHQLVQFGNSHPHLLP